MKDKELAEELLEELTGKVKDQQTERVVKELMIAYAHFKSMKVWHTRKDHSFKCPRCGSVQATEKGPGAILFCSECGQCIRLKNRERD